MVAALPTSAARLLAAAKITVAKVTTPAQAPVVSTKLTPAIVIAKAVAAAPVVQPKTATVVTSTGVVKTIPIQTQNVLDKIAAMEASTVKTSVSQPITTVTVATKTVEPTKSVLPLISGSFGLPSVSDIVSGATKTQTKTPVAETIKVETKSATTLFGLPGIKLVAEAKSGEIPKGFIKDVVTGTLIKQPVWTEEEKLDVNLKAGLPVNAATYIKVKEEALEKSKQTISDYKKGLQTQNKEQVTNFISGIKNIAETNKVLKESSPGSTFTVDNGPSGKVYTKEELLKANQKDSINLRMGMSKYVASSAVSSSKLNLEEKKITEAQKGLTLLSESIPDKKYTEIKQTGSGLTTSVDYSKWAKEELYKEGATPKNLLQAGSVAVTQAFNTEVWWAGITKGGAGMSEQIAKTEYGMAKDTTSSPLVKWVQLQAPAYENVILPLATGGVFKYISAGSKIAKAGTLTGAAYKYFVKPAQVGLMVTGSAVIGADIGYTAAKAPETLGPKMLGLGTQIGMIGVGASSDWGIGESKIIKGVDVKASNLLTKAKSVLPEEFKVKYESLMDKAQVREQMKLESLRYGEKGTVGKAISSVKGSLSSFVEPLKGFKIESEIGKGKSVSQAPTSGTERPVNWYENIGEYEEIKATKAQTTELASENRFMYKTPKLTINPDIKFGPSDIQAMRLELQKGGQKELVREPTYKSTTSEYQKGTGRPKQDTIYASRSGKQTIEIKPSEMVGSDIQKIRAEIKSGTPNELVNIKRYSDTSLTRGKDVSQFKYEIKPKTSELGTVMSSEEISTARAELNKGYSSQAPTRESQKMFPEAKTVKTSRYHTLKDVVAKGEDLKKFGIEEATRPGESFEKTPFKSENIKLNEKTGEYETTTEKQDWLGKSSGEAKAIDIQVKSERLEFPGVKKYNPTTKEYESVDWLGKSSKETTYPIDTRQKIDVKPKHVEIDTKTGEYKYTDKPQGWLEKSSGKAKAIDTRPKFDSSFANKVYDTSKQKWVSKQEYVLEKQKVSQNENVKRLTEEQNRVQQISEKQAMKQISKKFSPEELTQAISGKQISLQLVKKMPILEQVGRKVAVTKQGQKELIKEKIADIKAKEAIKRLGISTSDKVSFEQYQKQSSSLVEPVKVVTKAKKTPVRPREITTRDSSPFYKYQKSKGIEYTLEGRKSIFEGKKPVQKPGLSTTDSSSFAKYQKSKGTTLEKALKKSEFEKTIGEKALSTSDTASYDRWLEQQRKIEKLASAKELAKQKESQIKKTEEPKQRQFLRAEMKTIEGVPIKSEYYAGIKRKFKLSDVVKQSEKVIGETQTQRGGQQTIMEKPKTITEKVQQQIQEQRTKSISEKQKFIETKQKLANVESKARSIDERWTKSKVEKALSDLRKSAVKRLTTKMTTVKQAAGIREFIRWIDSKLGEVRDVSSKKASLVKQISNLKEIKSDVEKQIQQGLSDEDVKKLPVVISVIDKKIDEAQRQIDIIETKQDKIKRDVQDTARIPMAIQIQVPEVVQDQAQAQVQIQRQASVSETQPMLIQKQIQLQTPIQDKIQITGQRFAPPIRPVFRIPEEPAAPRKPREIPPEEPPYKKPRFFYLPQPEMTQVTHEKPKIFSDKTGYRQRSFRLNAPEPGSMLIPARKMQAKLYNSRTTNKGFVR